jgi:hypothetical protein
MHTLLGPPNSATGNHHIPLKATATNDFNGICSALFYQSGQLFSVSQSGGTARGKSSHLQPSYPLELGCRLGVR